MVNSYLSGEEKLKRVASEKGKKVPDTKNSKGDKGKQRVPVGKKPAPKKR